MTLYEQKQRQHRTVEKRIWKKMDTWTDSLYRVLIPMAVLGLIS